MKITADIKKEVERILPELRVQTEEEYNGWSGKKPGAGFYSDKKVLNTFTQVADNYFIFAKLSIQDSDNKNLNAQTAKAIRNITGVALRRLATGK